MLKPPSPTFIVLFDLKTGEVESEYAHPGHLVPLGVYDLEGDGDPELVMGGCDNAVNRATLAVFDPQSAGFHAASTVEWNETHEEGALFRVLFPRFPKWEDRSRHPRMHVMPYDMHHWLSTSRTLVIGVGNCAEELAFYAYLKNGYGVRPGETIIPDEFAGAKWLGLGLNIEEASRELERGIEVIWGARGSGVVVGGR